MKSKNLISSILGQTPVKQKTLAISNPHDFRQVCIKEFLFLHNLIIGFGEINHHHCVNLIRSFYCSFDDMKLFKYNIFVIFF